jgi:transposase
MSRPERERTAEEVKAAEGPKPGAASPEGARRATGGDAAAPSATALQPGQRWSRSRRREVVLRMLRGESVEDLSRELAVPVYRLEEWREAALAGIDGALRERRRSAGEEQLAQVHKRLGEALMDNELLRERCRRLGIPFPERRSRR